MTTISDAALWHDLECGRYTADLPCWRELAAARGGPVLDIGAGTGRVAIDLARRGHEVTALDHDPELLRVLARRAEEAGLQVSTSVADARDFRLDQTFSLIVVAMQTIQLLGDAGRAQLLSRLVEHLSPQGRLGVAITEHFDLYDAGDEGPDVLPEPDVLDYAGAVYVSQPTAVRRMTDGYILLERRRETLAADTDRVIVLHRERLDPVDAAQLEHEGVAAGLRLAGRREIAPTVDHVGSVVVMFDA